MASREYYLAKFRQAQRAAEQKERQIARAFTSLRMFRAREKRYMNELQITDEDRAAMIVEKRKRAAAMKAKRAKRTRAFAAESE